MSELVERARESVRKAANSNSPILLLWSELLTALANRLEVLEALLPDLRHRRQFLLLKKANYPPGSREHNYWLGRFDEVERWISDLDLSPDTGVDDSTERGGVDTP